MRDVFAALGFNRIRGLGYRSSRTMVLFSRESLDTEFFIAYIQGLDFASYNILMTYFFNL